MKKFETPEIEIIRYTVADVITTSNDGNPENPSDGMGWG